MSQILLVEPAYYTKYPPLALLKLSSYYKKDGNFVTFVQCRNGMTLPKQNPDEIFITSLFTYAWKKVHDAVAFYKSNYPGTPITVGGIYATLMPDHALSSGCDKVHSGLLHEAEDMVPDYTLVPDWDSSIIFSSRGCVRKCPFCAVPKMEPKYTNLDSIKKYIWPGHKKIVLWDNNFLASKYWFEILTEIEETNLEVDFNQGLDARLLTEEKAEKLSKLKITFVRMAYDDSRNCRVKDTIDLLSNYRFRRRDMFIYTLYNFKDNPEEFLDRAKSILSWGATCYPMRYQPLDALKKDDYIDPNWSNESLTMLVKARRVLGYGGAFPPYKGLIEKFNKAKDFSEAMALRPPSANKPKDGKGELCRDQKVAESSITIN